MDEDYVVYRGILFSKKNKEILPLEIKCMNLQVTALREIS